MMELNEMREKLEALSRKKAKLIDSLGKVREAEWRLTRAYDIKQREEVTARKNNAVVEKAIETMSVEEMKVLYQRIRQTMADKELK